MFTARAITRTEDTCGIKCCPYNSQDIIITRKCSRRSVLGVELAYKLVLRLSVYSSTSAGKHRPSKEHMGQRGAVYGG